MIPGRDCISFYATTGCLIFARLGVGSVIMIRRNIFNISHTVLTRKSVHKHNTYSIYIVGQGMMFLYRTIGKMEKKKSFHMPILIETMLKHFWHCACMCHTTVAFWNALRGIFFFIGIAHIYPPVLLNLFCI